MEDVEKLRACIKELVDKTKTEKELRLLHITISAILKK